MHVAAKPAMVVDAKSKGKTADKLVKAFNRLVVKELINIFWI